MMEDHLTRDERIRLEALNQANITVMNQPPEVVIKRAAAFEDYIRNGTLKGGKKSGH